MPATPTVSRWPFRRSERPPPLPRRRAMMLGRSSPTISTSKPCPRHHSATTLAASRSPAPPETSVGLTESVATRRDASSTISFTAPLRDRHPLQHDRDVQRVVELVRLLYAGRCEHVGGLRNATRVRRAVRVVARGRAHAEQEVLRSRCEAPRLIAREPILAVEHDRERPAGAGGSAEARLRDAECDVPGDLVRVDRDRPDCVPRRVLVALAEAL